MGHQTVDGPHWMNKIWQKSMGPSRLVTDILQNVLIFEIGHNYSVKKNILMICNHKIFCLSNQVK